ncbi:hypothetical protein AOLI_G00056850 [Acnodon oligacanthus]
MDWGMNGMFLNFSSFYKLYQPIISQNAGKLYELFNTVSLSWMFSMITDSKIRSLPVKRKSRCFIHEVHLPTILPPFISLISVRMNDTSYVTNY